MKKRQSVLSRDACKAGGEGGDDRVSSTPSDKGRGGHMLVSL